jgi:hypothetical protein
MNSTLHLVRLVPLAARISTAENFGLSICRWGQSAIACGRGRDRAITRRAAATAAFQTTVRVFWLSFSDPEFSNSIGQNDAARRVFPKKMKSETVTFQYRGGKKNKKTVESRKASALSSPLGSGAWPRGLTQRLTAPRTVCTKRLRFSNSMHIRMTEIAFLLRKLHPVLY